MDFETYVRDHRAALMRFATVLSGQPWVAEDIVSDVLGRAFERWDRIAHLERPHAYVRRMIVNDFVSLRRRLRRVTSLADRPDVEQNVDDTTGSHAERDAMIGRLASLPPKQRAAIVLRFYLDLSMEQVAKELECTESTARSQISRALRTLRINELESHSAIPERTSKETSRR